MSLTGNFDRREKVKMNEGRVEKSTDFEGENYSKEGYARNLSFVTLDGNRQFYNYADLTLCVFLNVENIIMLEFRGTTIKLKGQNLEKLYNKLRSHIPKEIVCVDGRYTPITKTENPQITEIIFEKK